jgi:hypothetical protein
MSEDSFTCFSGDKLTIDARRYTSELLVEFRNFLAEKSSENLEPEFNGILLCSFGRGKR